MNEKLPSSDEKPTYKVTFAEIEHHVDTANVSYNDGFEYFGVTPDEVDYGNDETESVEPIIVAASKTSREILASIKPGPSLSLKGRAEALAIIMDQFNKENRARGAHFPRDYNDMQRRYGADTEKVLNNMSAIANRMGSEALEAVFTLARGDSDVPMPDDVDFSGPIESHLRRDYGPGNAYARDREKLVKTAYKTARIPRPKK